MLCHRRVADLGVTSAQQIVWEVVVVTVTHPPLLTQPDVTIKHQSHPKTGSAGEAVSRDPGNG